MVGNGDFMEFDYSSIIKSEIQEPEELEVCYTAQDESDSMLGFLQQQQQQQQMQHQSITEPNHNDVNEVGRPAMTDDDCRRESNYQQRKRMMAAKRKSRVNYDSRVSTAICKLVRKISDERENRDECSVYGEYVSHKLRNYDFRTRCIVQHQINDIIFHADMGKVLTDGTDSVSDTRNKFRIGDIRSMACDGETKLVDGTSESSGCLSDGKPLPDT